MKVLIVVPYHSKARIDPIPRAPGTYALSVRPDFIDKVRVYKFEDDGAQIELKEEEDKPMESEVNNG